MNVCKILVALTFSLVAVMTNYSSAQPLQSPVVLPQTIGDYALSDSVQKVHSRNIFEYMNGAGELYLAYRFDHLDVYEYTSEGDDDILVEIYVMQSPEDAFGLLSLDWTGEPVDLRESPSAEATAAVAPPHRALYGLGLLRVWSDAIYARVMAYRVSPASEAAVLAIGRAIAANRAKAPKPRLLRMLSPLADADGSLLQDRIRYFRSHLVLNSFYYLSHQNILNLDLSCEALAATLEKTTPSGEQVRIQFLFIKYADAEQARQALMHFHKAYLSEAQEDTDRTNAINFYKIEAGWVGYRQIDRCVALVFDCPDRETAKLILNRINLDLIK